MVGVSLHHSWIPVPKQLLDEVDVFPLLREPRCESVTEIVEPETAYFTSFRRAPESSKTKSFERVEKLGLDWGMFQGKLIFEGTSSAHG